MATTTLLNGEVRVVISGPAIQAMLDSDQGPVVRELFRVGEKVKRRAIAIAPVGKPDPLGRSRGGHRPGNLRAHIVKRLVRGKNGRPQMLVGIDGKQVPYAFWVHEGAKPHIIRASNAPLLVFYWPKLGRVVAFPYVHHPGNKPNRFLIRALAGAKQ